MIDYMIGWSSAFQARSVLPSMVRTTKRCLTGLRTSTQVELLHLTGNLNAVASLVCICSFSGHARGLMSRSKDEAFYPTDPQFYSCVLTTSNRVYNVFSRRRRCWSPLVPLSIIALLILQNDEF